MTLAEEPLRKPIEHTEFHGEFTEIFEDFCGVDGLTVQFDVDDGAFLFNPHGPDGLAYVRRP